MSKSNTLVIGGLPIVPGETRDIRLKMSESYTGDSVVLPLRVLRAARPGPTVFLTAAVHGDELNGTGIIRELIFGEPLPLRKGTLICVPVVNVFGFESHTRYLPDRRDLNRSFPGGERGSLARRVARTIFREIVMQCDYGLDLHTAAVRNTNFPNIRADLSMPQVRRLAEAFGCELIVNSKGPEGSLRRSACENGCPTVVLEAGEVWKIEPGVVDAGTVGVRNVLMELGMLAGAPNPPPYQVIVQKTVRVRAEVGGILRFHVAPGDLVEAGQAIASNVSIFGDARALLVSPVDGIVLGMTTLPAAKPGEPVCHIAIPNMPLSTIRQSLAQSGKSDIHQRMRDALATNISISEQVIGDHR